MKFEEEQEVWLKNEVTAFIQKRQQSQEIHDEGEVSFRIEDQSVVIFEKLKRWRHPFDSFESMIAKVTFVKASADWKVYWQKSDMKWHRYNPEPTAGHFDDFLEMVGFDAYGCFRG